MRDWDWIRRGEAGGEDSGDRQRRHPHARGRVRMVQSDRMRCGDDRTNGAFESVDLPPDCSNTSRDSAVLRRTRAKHDRYQMIRTYFQMLLEEEMPGAEGKMKQFASWFTHGVPGGAALRKEIYDAKSGAEILSRVEGFFEARLCAPRDLAMQTGDVIPSA